jgi:hypothetical protein
LEQAEWYQQADQYAEWFRSARIAYEIDRRLARVFKWHKQIASHGRTSVKSDEKISSSKAESLRSEFNTLAEQWNRDTRHISQVSKKVTHAAYLRIIGMGGAVVPLLLEELRNRPAHWFVALRATTNEDPVPMGSTPAGAREAWLAWGRAKGFID